MPVMTTRGVGYGVGKKEFERANCVRAFWGETADAANGEIAELVCNVDDMTPEALSYACARLLEEGALDVYATEINEAMKIAAAEALAALAKEPVPAEVCSAYNVDSLEYGFDYIIPKPLDPRILTCITPAVAKAAMDTGVARKRIEDLDGYARELERRVKASHDRIRPFVASYE